MPASNAEDRQARAAHQLPRLQVLIHEERVTYSIWTTVHHKCRTIEGLRKMARSGVKSGAWLGYRFHEITEEYIGATW